MADLATTETYKPLHLAASPGGPCSICRAPWPCTVERKALLDEYREARSSLLIYLCLRLIEALDHNPVEVAAELRSRYLGWVPPPADGGDPTLSTTQHHQHKEDARHAGRAA